MADPTQMTIKVLGEDYITAKNAQILFNITSDRLKKWRESKGVARTILLRTFKLNAANYLYNLNDLKRIIDLHKISLIKK